MSSLLAHASPHAPVVSLADLLDLKPANAAPSNQFKGILDGLQLSEDLHENSRGQHRALIPGSSHKKEAQADSTSSTSESIALPTQDTKPPKAFLAIPELQQPFQSTSKATTESEAPSREDVTPDASGEESVPVQEQSPRSVVPPAHLIAPAQLHTNSRPALSAVSPSRDRLEPSMPHSKSLLCSAAPSEMPDVQKSLEMPASNGGRNVTSYWALSEPQLEFTTKTSPRSQNDAIKEGPGKPAATSVAIETAPRLSVSSEQAPAVNTVQNVDHNAAPLPENTERPAAGLPLAAETPLMSTARAPLPKRAALPMAATLPLSPENWQPISTSNGSSSLPVQESLSKSSEPNQIVGSKKVAASGSTVPQNAKPSFSSTNLRSEALTQETAPVDIESPKILPAQNPAHWQRTAPAMQEAPQNEIAPRRNSSPADHAGTSVSYGAAQKFSSVEDKKPASENTVTPPPVPFISGLPADLEPALQNEQKATSDSAPSAADSDTAKPEENFTAEGSQASRITLAPGAVSAAPEALFATPTNYGFTALAAGRKIPIVPAAENFAFAVRMLGLETPSRPAAPARFTLASSTVDTNPTMPPSQREIARYAGPVLNPRTSQPAATVEAHTHSTNLAQPEAPPRVAESETANTDIQKPADLLKTPPPALIPRPLATPVVTSRWNDVAILQQSELAPLETTLGSSEEVHAAAPVNVQDLHLLVPEFPKNTTSSQILLHLSANDQSSAAIRIADRAGAVNVSVHASDPALRESLRSNLSDLSTQLSAQGWKPEVSKSASTPAHSDNPQESFTQGRGQQQQQSTRSDRQPPRERRANGGQWQQELDQQITGALAPSGGNR